MQLVLAVILWCNNGMGRAYIYSGCSAHIINEPRPDDFQAINPLGVLRGIGRFIGQVFK